MMTVPKFALCLLVPILFTVTLFNIILALHVLQAKDTDGIQKQTEMDGKLLERYFELPIENEEAVTPSSCERLPQEEAPSNSPARRKRSGKPIKPVLRKWDEDAEQERLPEFTVHVLE